MRRPGWPYKEEFACHRCGNCCRGDGFVELTEKDLARISEHLQMSVEEFLAAYCVKSEDGPILKDQEDEEQSCIFLTVDEKGLFGCRIHQAKPIQCAGFPFLWRPRNALKFCNGMRALEGLPPVGLETMTPEKK